MSADRLNVENEELKAKLTNGSKMMSELEKRMSKTEELLRAQDTDVTAESQMTQAIENLVDEDKQFITESEKAKDELMGHVKRMDGEQQRLNMVLNDTFAKYRLEYEELEKEKKDKMDIIKQLNNERSKFDEVNKQTESFIQKMGAQEAEVEQANKNATYAIMHDLEEEKQQLDNLKRTAMSTQ